MRSLKVLVVVMGVLLVGGTVALVAAIIGRASHRAAAPALRSVAARGFDRAVVDLPAGARVLGSEAADGRLVVRIGLAAGGEEFLLIDPASGALLGTIELRPAAAGDAR